MRTKEDYAYIAVAVQKLFDAYCGNTNSPFYIKMKYNPIFRTEYNDIRFEYSTTGYSVIHTKHMYTRTRCITSNENPDNLILYVPDCNTLYTGSVDAEWDKHEVPLFTDIDDEWFFQRSTVDTDTVLHYTALCSALQHFNVPMFSARWGTILHIVEAYTERLNLFK